MADDKREHERSKVDGVTISYDAGADTIEGTVRDIGRGGLFIISDKPLGVGKRIIFDIKASGGSISGAGRVVWVRDAAQGGDVVERLERPAGMGVKFIDVDDSALVVIDALVAEKRPTAAKQRERTVMGLGIPQELPKPAAAPAPAPEPEKPRERTAMGVGPGSGAAPPRPSRERTVMGVGIAVPPRTDAPSQPEVPDEGWDTPEPDPKAVTKPEIVLPPTAIVTPAKVELPKSEPAKAIDLQPPTMPAAVIIPPEAKPPPPEPEPPPPEPEPAPAVPQAEAKAEPKPEPEPKPAPKREVSTGREISVAGVPKKGGSSAGIIIVLLLAVAGVAAYLKRDQLMPLLGMSPPAQPTTTAPPTATPSASAPPVPVSVSASAASAPPAISASAIVPEAAMDASADAAKDAAADAGIADAGKKPATAPTTTTTSAPTSTPKPKPKPTATATGDNPY